MSSIVSLAQSNITEPSSFSIQRKLAGRRRLDTSYPKSRIDGGGNESRNIFSPGYLPTGCASI
ncbi:hypothetical protein PGTUg99_019762 [Puccinia graminis f. sp. tritici]|uniref:Uncharacterized protein n=1 Tax=Puccinia graminis f. sp. tritici TaxID=56615 RepID=A0A5B0S672_PUCGR|nr:hypothetical protein PGTUg99_019762 [Puccinia graminis f. sp. tritici]